MSFFLEDAQFNTRESFYSLSENVTFDILSMNEAVNTSDLQARDILIESMQSEAYYTLNEAFDGAKDKAKAVGNTIKEWFQKMWNLIKDMLAKVKNFFAKIFNKMFGMAERLERYVSKHKKAIAKAGSAEVKALSTFGEGNTVLMGQPGNAAITHAAYSAMQSLKSLEDKGDIAGILKKLKVGSEKKDATVKAADVLGTYKNGRKMIDGFRKAFQSEVKVLQESEKAAKDGLQAAKKAEEKDQEKIRELKQVVSVKHKAAAKANKIISLGVSLINKLLSNTMKAAKALVKKSGESDKEDKKEEE